MSRKPAIPNELYGPMLRTLSKCIEFADGYQLRSLVGGHAQLKQWQDQLQDYPYPQGRASAVMAYFHERHDVSTGENALTILLMVLAVRREETDDQHKELKKLAKQWELARTSGEAESETRLPKANLQPDRKRAALNDQGDIQNTARLTGPEVGKLVQILLAMFDRDGFKELFLYQLDINLSIHINENTGNSTYFRDAILFVNQQRRVDQVIDAARLWNPDPDLIEFAENRKLGASTTSIPASILGSGFEKMIKKGRGILNFSKWRSKLLRLESQICFVDTPSGIGTGFLVGPDMIITNYHVIEDLLGEHKLDEIRKVRVYFDYFVMKSHPDQESGIVYGLYEDEKEWLLCCSPPADSELNNDFEQIPPNDRLDFAVLKLNSSAGESIIGGDANLSVLSDKLRSYILHEKQTTLEEYLQRGWIVLNPNSSKSIRPGEPVFVLQHPQGDSLSLAIDDLLQFNSNNTRMRYETNTLDGSSGSPCFDVNWNLIGLHHAGDPRSKLRPKYNQGIPIQAIADYVRKHDLDLFSVMFPSD